MPDERFWSSSEEAPSFSSFRLGLVGMPWFDHTRRGSVAAGTIPSPKGDIWLNRGRQPAVRSSEVYDEPRSGGTHPAANIVLCRRSAAPTVFIAEGRLADAHG